jgi:phage gp29-like protein
MVDLVDAQGRPIRRQELQGEPQTAAVAHLYREYADHPSRGLTPAKLARILEEAERGELMSQARLGEDMEEKDAHLFAELSKRRRAILGLSWDLQPPPEATEQERRETARIEAIIRELDWETILYDATAAILHGYACLEYDWDRSGGEWRPRSVDYRQPDWFMCQPEARNELLLRTQDGLGEPLRPWGWMVHLHKAKSGYLVRGGLSRVLAWPYLFRNFSARDLAEFLEIYGLPLRLGKYPAGANEQEKATLMRAVVNIGHAAAGIIPQGMDLEFQEATKGASDPFMAMMRWAEASMSKAILGATLTSQPSDSGGGAYALGEVHNEVRHDILVSDARQLARTLSRQLVEPLVRLNSRMTRMPTWVFDTEQPEDLKLYADALPNLVRMGMRIPARWAHEKLRIPEPEADELVLEERRPAPGPMALRSQPRAPVAAARTASADELPERWAERLEADSAEAFGGMLEPVRRLLASVDSLEEFRERLADLYDDMPDEQLARIMQMALAAAELAGRDQVENDEA